MRLKVWQLLFLLQALVMLVAVLCVAAYFIISKLW